MRKIWHEKKPVKCFIAQKTLPVLVVMSAFFLLLGLILFFAIVFNSTYFNFSFIIDKELASDFGTFFQGLIGTIFGIAGALLVAVSLIYQSISTKKTSIESLFFTMVEFHRSNVSNISIKSYKDYANKDADKIEGSRAFVIFKLQLFDIIKVVENLKIKLNITLSEDEEINLVYLIFYYGIDKSWDEFSNIHFQAYDRKLLNAIEEERIKILKNTKVNIGRTNQTILSAYYRNMYNAIKFIDESIYLTPEEKYNYIKMYRAQFSNSELAVLFFNVKSNFGKNWKSYEKDGKRIEHNLIEKYQLIKSIPEGYIMNYDHKKSFDMEYEDDELNT